MEEQWYAARAALRHLRQKHPDWSLKRLAEEIGYSYNWVKKWCQRLDQAPSQDPTVLCSHSRRPKTASPRVKPAVIAQILAIRDDPPANLKRTPGPVAIKYYLQQCEELKQQGYYLPTSTSTLWAILDQHGRINRPSKVHEPVTRAAALTAWQMDFKDVTTVTAEPSSKQLHLVETLNIVDSGSSILIDNPARMDYNAETVIETVAATLQQHGCPQRLTFDRDPRFVGSWRGDGFPSALMRFLLCLGIQVEVCPPQRPDKNCFVERYHRSYDQEAIQIYGPATYEQVLEMNRDYRHHYNYERPNQALTCGNRPPRLVFAQVPPLPPLPTVVDPDRWLEAIEGHLFKRRVSATGTVALDKHDYYIRRELKGRTVLLQVDAANHQLQVLLGQQEVIKTLPLKGLHQQPLSFEAYLRLIQAEAVSEWRRYLQRARHYVHFVA